MDNMLEQFFNNNFGNQGNGVNPFDTEAFASFIYDQIKNAMPQNMNGFQNNTTNQQNSPGTSPKRQQGASKSQASPFPIKNGEIKYNVFEMHDYVIVRIAMPNMNSDKKRSVFVNSHEVLLKEEGREDPLLQIPLPKPVSSKKAKLSKQNGILEIQILKKPQEEHNEFEISNLE